MFESTLSVSSAIEPMNRTALPTLILAGVMGLLAGCRTPSRGLVPVNGTVSLDGVPLAFKSLLFFPTDGTGGNGAGGFTDGEGKFALIGVVFGATADFEGCPPGRYRVVVSESTIPLSEADFQSRRRKSYDGEPEVAIGPTRRVNSEIPARYTAVQTTPLLLEVPESGGTIHVELTSAPD